MEFSLWRKDGAGNRYAVSKSSVDAKWVSGYLIQIAEGQWTIEGDPSGAVYPFAEDAAKVLIERDKRSAH